MCIPLGGGSEVDGDADDCGEYFVFWLPFACVCTFRAKQFLLLFLWLLVFRFRLGLNILLQAIAARMKWERNVLRSRRWQPAFVVQWRASNEMPQTNTMNICTNLIRQSIVCFCQVGHDTHIQHTSAINKPAKKSNDKCWLLDRERIWQLVFSGKNQEGKARTKKIFFSAMNGWMRGAENGLTQWTEGNGSAELKIHSI